VLPWTTIESEGTKGSTIELTTNDWWPKLLFVFYAFEDFEIGRKQYSSI
jgi:hypothetical protein